MLDNFTITGNKEILQVADAIAREKVIGIESVICALEAGVVLVAKKKYGSDLKIDVSIDRKTGEINIYNMVTVVTDQEISTTSSRSIMDLPRARKIDHTAEIGSIVKISLPPVDLNRAAAAIAKQEIIRKVKDAERDKEFANFKNMAGTIANGVVKKIGYRNVVVDIGGSEAILPESKMIPREVFRVDDRVRAYIEDVRREERGSQIFLSRTHIGFMMRLFAQEVPEIYDGTIEIKALARDAGSRAKIAVFCPDDSVDVVGSCVGVRGSRVQAVSTELKGEKIDIIKWSRDPATFVISALSPARISKVILDEEQKFVEVVLAEDQLSLAIGRKGQNVRLASDLTGFKIDLMTEEDESKRRTGEFTRASELFMKALDVEEMIAQLLASEGFMFVEDLAYVDTSELANIDGFNEEIAEEIKNRAATWVSEYNAKINQRLKELKIEENLTNLENMTGDILIKLGESGIKNKDNLGDLSFDELSEILAEFELSPKIIDNFISTARADWFTEIDGEIADNDK